MAVRKRSLKPDPKGRYRPYLGSRIDGKQQRFNLGADRAEAERRMNRLYELWEENVRANGEEVWSPLALHFAKQIAEGKRKIEYPFQSHFLEADDPALAKRIRGRVLAFHGHDDPLVPFSQVDAFRREMTEAGVDWELVVYGGAVHGFTNPAAHAPDRGVLYHADVARRAAARVEAFYRDCFAG